MNRPVAALSSQLLVRKGSARPLGLEPTEWTPLDAARAVRPAEAASLANVHPFAVAEPVEPEAPVARSRDVAGRVIEAWGTLASRWGLPSILFVVGLGLVTVVAATGPGPAPATDIANIAAPSSRPMGPTPVTWIDPGLMANPALAGR